MNKKCSFFTKNIFPKMLLLLGGFMFATEVVYCAIIHNAVETLDVVEGLPGNPFATKIAPDQISHAVIEEEIGTQTHGEITELAAPASSKYERLDWWLSVLPVIRQTAGMEEFDTYEKIVNRSLSQIGLAYKHSEAKYVGQTLAEGLGLGITSDDFETAFNKKLDEFKIFSFNYLKPKTVVEQRAYLETYHATEDAFTNILQKLDMRKVGKYEIIHIGDLRGDLVSLLTILKNYEKLFNADFSLKDKSKIFVCTGDSFDRGQFGLEVLFILMSLKIKNPDNVYLSLGNHAAAHEALANHDQGFAREVTRKFNLGPVEFSEGPRISGPGAKPFAKFMKRVQSSVFKYLPSALFMKTEFGNILFCHSLPDHMDEIAQPFLQFPEEIQFAFGNQHPANMLYTYSELEIRKHTDDDQKEGCPIPGKTKYIQSLEAVGEYMDKLGIVLCMRGHQHNPTLEANFDVYSGGVMVHQASDLSVLVTTLSFDFACYYYTESCQRIDKLGDYAHCCVLEKDGNKLNVQGISIDRRTAERVSPRDRTNPKFSIEDLVDTSSEKDEKVAPTEGIEHADKIEREKISQLCIEVKRLSTGGMPIFGCPDLAILQTFSPQYLENLRYFFTQIQPLHKMNLAMINELLILLGVQTATGKISTGTLAMPIPKKLQLYSLMNDKTEGIPALMDKISHCRTQLADSVETQIANIEPIIQEINDCRYLLARRLQTIIDVFGPIQSYLNQTDEFKQSIVKRLKSLVSNPEKITFNQIFLSILGNPRQGAV